MASVVALNVRQAVIQCSPARRPTLNLRKMELTVESQSHYNSLNWCTGEILGQNVHGIAVSCMGGLLPFLFIIHVLFHKWRKYKGTHPVASRVAARGAAAYHKVARRVDRVYTRKKRFVAKKVALFKLWCLVYYYIAYGKTMRAWFQWKKKYLNPLKRHVDRIIHTYCHVCKIIYRYAPTSAMVILMHLLLSGDVEQNPGPKDGHLTIKDLGTVQSALWEARSQWYNLGLQLGVAVDDLDVIKRTNLQNDDECLTDLFRQWLRRADPQPTWEAIEKALQSRTVNLSQLATKIVNEKIDSTNDSKTEPIKHENFEVECSNAQAQAVVVKSDASFPHIREFQGLDEEEKEYLEQRLIMESENIQLSFSTLCNKFFDSLEDIPLKKLIRVLKGLQALKRVNSSKSASVIQSYEYVLENITDIEEVKDLIEECSTFFDFRPVEYMIQNVGLERHKQLLEKYKEDFEHYIKRRIFECPCEVGPPEAPNSTKLYVKLESDYDKLIDLKQFQCRLSLILEVSIHVLRLSSVKDGCIQLTFLIPSFIQEAIFPLSADQERDMKELGIIKLWCENYYFPNQEQSDDDDDANDDKSDFNEASIGAENTKGSTSGVDHDSGLGTSRYKSTMSYTMSDETMEMPVACDTFEDIDMSSDSDTLLKAAHRGNLKEVTKLIEEDGHSPYETGKFGNCSLHYAAAGGRVNVLRYLIEHHGCSHSPEGHFKQIPLHIAAQYGQLEVVKYFTAEQNVDPSNQDKFLRTPLHYACIGGNLDLVQYLINEISRYQPMDQCKLAYDKTKAESTPLQFASVYGHLDIVQYFIIDLKSDPCTRGKQKRTILHDAADSGHKNIVSYLIDEQKCNPMLICEDGNTPLHLAAAKGHLEVVRLLALDKRFDFTRCRNSQNFTPLHIAALNGHLSVVQLLTHEAKWDPNITGWMRRTPLHLAAMKGHFSIVKHFMEEMNCNQFIEDKDRKTPSELAKQCGHMNVASYLDLLFMSVIVTKGNLDSLKWFFNKFTECDHSLLNILYGAAAYGHLHIVKYLIEERNWSSLACNRNGDTPLHVAAENGHLSIVKYLTIIKQCSPTVQGKDHQTPVHLAALQGHLEVITFFISDLNCDPNIPGHSGQTPLHSAASLDQLHIVKYLIEEQNCNPLCLDDNDDTPLHYASQSGSLEVVKYLSSRTKYDNTIKYVTDTSLHLASYEGHLEVVRFFIIDLKCNPNIPAGMSSIMPLHAAAGNDQVHIMEYLIKEHKCNPLCLDKYGNTPLHHAVVTGSLKAVEYLTLEIKCDPTLHRKNECMQTPYHAAALEGQLEIFKFFLLRLNCSPNIYATDGHLPLHLAASKGHLHIMKYLIEEQNCDPSCLNETGGTPLHYASRNGSLLAAKYLVLKHNCDPTHCDSGNSSIHIAVSRGHLELVKFFISDFNCDPNILDEFKCTPLHAAACEGHVHIMRYLIEVCGCDPRLHLDIGGNTVLHYASLNGSLEAVRYLTLERMCDPIPKNNVGIAPIHIALLRGQLEIVKFYVTILKCDPNIPGAGKNNLLHLAAFVGHTHIVKYLLDKQNYGVHWRKDQILEALMEAQSQGPGHIYIYLCLLVRYFFQCK